MKAVGRAVRSTRKDAGLTQEKLAEAAEIAPRVLQKIETGQITILVTKLICILPPLAVTLTTFCGNITSAPGKDHHQIMP